MRGTNYAEQFRRPESHANLEKRPVAEDRSHIKYGLRSFTTVAVRPLGFERHCNGRLYSDTGCNYITQVQPIDKGQGAPVPHHRLGPTPSPRARTLRGATFTAQLTIIDPSCRPNCRISRHSQDASPSFPPTIRGARGIHVDLHRQDRTGSVGEDNYFPHDGTLMSELVMTSAFNQNAYARRPWQI